MVEQGERLGLIVSAWTDLVRGGDQELLAGILDESVTWQGLRPGLVCRGRGEVMSLLDRYRARPPRMTRLEAEEAGDRVAITVEGPDLPVTEFAAADAPRSIVFVFRGRTVIRMESFPNRDAAFAALASGG